MTSAWRGRRIWKFPGWERRDEVKRGDGGGGKEEFKAGMELGWGIPHGSTLLGKLQELWRTGKSSTEAANG